MSDHRYVARFGWTPRDLILVPGCIVFVLVGAVMVIEAVVLWRQGRGWRSIRYIGVVRRAGAPPLPGSARSPLLRSLNQAVVPPGLAEDLVADSRQVSFWRLDRARLTAAVGHFRPGLPIEDHT